MINWDHGGPAVLGLEPEGEQQRGPDATQDRGGHGAHESTGARSRDRHEVVGVNPRESMWLETYRQIEFVIMTIYYG